MSDRPRILHIIVGLGIGGAERSLCRLVIDSRDNLEHTVVCVGDRTSITSDLEHAGITIHHFSRSPFGMLRALRFCRGFSCDVVQGWMYYGSVLASLAGSAGGKRTVSWNIRHALADSVEESGGVRFALRMLKRMRPHVLIYNSEAGRASHTALGFQADTIVHIPNGVDTHTLAPSAERRQEMRRSLGIHEDDRVVGFVGRFHPHKGVDVFLAALLTPLRKDLRLRLILAGKDLRKGDTEFGRLLVKLGYADAEIERVHAVGPQMEMPDLYCAMDVFVLASRVEGTPNALLEAMSCGVTAVATDVGDAAAVVDDPARVCAPQDPIALAALVEHALEGLIIPSNRDRQRVLKAYDSERCNAAYIDLYNESTALLRSK